MLEFNKDRIFNESSTKVLMREFNNLKEDYSKINALKYKELYENESLSFILEHSRYIFAEPMKGCEFYKNLMESTLIPLDCLEVEYEKVTDFVSENISYMSEKQSELYNKLLNVVTEKYNKLSHTVNLYNAMMESTDSMHKYYDALYEYKRTNKEETLKEVSSFFENEKDTRNVIDATYLFEGMDEFSSDLYMYLKDCYVESPMNEDDYRLNLYTSNTLKRMMLDKTISEAVSHNGNVNLRHLIQGISNVNEYEYIENNIVETVKNFDMNYSSPENSVNRMFEDVVYSEMFEEENTTEKLNRLNNEKAILEMSMGFLIMDADYTDNSIVKNTIIENACFESTEIEKIPQTVMGQISFLESMLNDVDEKINLITEKYFTSTGGASKIISREIGSSNNDSKFSSKSSSDKEVDKEVDKVYTSSKKEEDEDDDEEYKKSQDAKKRRDEKYSNMDVSDDDLNKMVSEKSNVAYEEIEKPEKRNVFQRIQNKALDANVQFKKKLANAKRKSVDAKNAGKAVSKIPTSISASVKKQIDEWDELDDDRRKEYIMKPGFRKKYFKALKLCILHYGAFAVNPILNIVLLICHKFSNTKDIRIRNELTRELKAEIAVTAEKIEDAKANNDNKQKYELMRIKEKLEAELVRVGANSKFI